MKNILFFINLLWIVFATNTSSQVLRVDNGSSWSWTNYSSKINASYIASVGLDYLEKDHFMMTSRLGYLSKGQNAPLMMPKESRLIAKIDYLGFSTTGRFKQPGLKGHFFIGLGPTFDFKLNSRYKVEGVIGENGEGTGDFLSEDFVFGFLAETGYYYDFSNVRFELNMGYRNNITKIIPDTRKGFIGHSITASVGVGYIF